MLTGGNEDYGDRRFWLFGPSGCPRNRCWCSNAICSESGILCPSNGRSYRICCSTNFEQKLNKYMAIICIILASIRILHLFPSIFVTLKRLSAISQCFERISLQFRWTNNWWLFLLLAHCRREQLVDYDGKSVLRSRDSHIITFK